MAFRDIDVLHLYVSKSWVLIDFWEDQHPKKTNMQAQTKPMSLGQQGPKPITAEAALSAPAGCSWPLRLTTLRMPSGGFSLRGTCGWAEEDAGGVV